MRILFALIIALVVCSSSALAGEDLNLPKQLINPDSVAYPAKRLWEKISLNLLFAEESRFNYQKSLWDKRLAELGYVVDNKFVDQIQKSSERFAYQSGIIAEQIIKDFPAEKYWFSKRSIVFTDYLSKLRDKYPANSSYWMLVSHDINTLKILTDKLNVQ